MAALAKLQTSTVKSALGGIEVKRHSFALTGGSSVMNQQNADLRRIRHAS